MYNISPSLRSNGKNPYSFVTEVMNAGQNINRESLMKISLNGKIRTKFSERHSQGSHQVSNVELVFIRY